MSLIDQQKDLENFSDQALLQEAMQPMRGYPPFLVASEIQRRQQDRARVQQQTMAAQPEAPPVAMQQASQFASQMAASMAVPEAALQPDMGQMPPEMGMGMAGSMAGSAASPEPVGIMSAAPVQGMSSGGEVKRMQEGKEIGFFERVGPFTTERGVAANRAALSRFFTPRRSEVALVRSIEQIEKAGGDASALRAELARLKGTAVPAIGEAPVATSSSAVAITPSPAPATTSSSAPGISGITMGVTPPASIFNVRPGTDFSGVAPTSTTDTSRDEGITGLPMPRRGDFMSTYRDVLGRIRPLEEVGIQSRKDILEGRVTPQGRVALDPFYVEEAKRLEQFRPSREKFERGSQSEILAGLGAIIGGATQRGDIAKGLAALTRQQREAERDFRREEREFAGFESGLRREERSEAMMRDQARAAAAREGRQFERQDISDALAMTQAIETSRYQADKLAAEVQNLNLQLQIAKQEAASKGMSRQLELIVKTLEAKLTQAKTAEAAERTKALEIENSMNVKFASGGGGSYTRPEGLFTPTQ